MLMIPPALATKSGVQRMPRAWSASATASVASWLFAAPATARQRSAGTDSSSSRPPSAHGATTSTSARSASGRLGPGRAPARPRARASPRDDVGEHERGAARREAARERAADVAEADHGDRPAGEVRRAPDASHVTRIAASTPSAVHGLGSPEPPRSTREAGDVVRPLRDHRHVARRTCRRPRRSRSGRRAGRRASPKSSSASRRRSPGRAAASPARQHDHALAAAEREPCGRRLQGHRARRAAARRGRPRACPRSATSGSRRATGRARWSAPRRRCRGRSAGRCGRAAPRGRASPDGSRCPRA